MEDLRKRGIEPEKEWKEYFAAMEKGGELIADLCGIIKVDVLQLTGRVKKLKYTAGAGETAGRCPSTSLRVENKVNQTEVLQVDPMVSGQISANNWSGRPASVMTVPAREEPGGDVCMQLVQYLRAMTCSDPGVFRRTAKENFKEFLRKFKRKYESVIVCEATSVDILADDHLAGQAKNVFKSLPRVVKEGGFHLVLTEMARLLTFDSTAKRTRALAELKISRLMPNQDLESCVPLV